MHGMASAQNAEKKSKNVGCTCINPTPCARILHPILHPKSSVNTRNLTPWCRKCRRFSKTFFVEGGREGRKRCCGPEAAKHRTSLGKSTDVLLQKYGCFHRRSPMFLFSGKGTTLFERFVKPYEQRSSLLEYDAMARKRRYLYQRFVKRAQRQACLSCAESR